MAGIYIHIPFCKKSCHYCDFHFTTSFKYKNELLEALFLEIELQKLYLQEPIETIYFGGGTPSVIGADEIQKLVDRIAAYYDIRSDAETTLECNPDDLDANFVNELRNTSVNRLSIGIQSFFDEDLIWMNRAHNSSEAEGAVKRVQDAGFENITVDLIYGYPLLSDEKFESNMMKVIDFEIPHVSAYSMTVEPNTALSAFIKTQKQTAMDDTQSAEQYLNLINTFTSAGFEHYETSNFAKPGRYSKHNSNYWRGRPYLGIGPSAHSFNSSTRQWNIANNAKYIREISAGHVPAEVEVLTLQNRINEYILISLRTMWGMDLNKIAADFGKSVRAVIERNLSPFLKKGQVERTLDTIQLTQEGKFYADMIASELFFTADTKI